MSKQNGNSLQKLAAALIRDEEIPLRRKNLPAETVRIIMRYGAIIGSDIEQHTLLPRGMEHARHLVGLAEEQEKSFKSGTIILADEMTLGKGRFQRPWFAPAGGLWCTLVLVNTLLPENTHLYPLAAGIATCETMRRFNIPAHIKWVNDIHVQGRKLAGILAETFTGPRYGEEYVLIGIGINVNNTAFPDELTDSAAAMKTLLGREMTLPAVTACLLAKLTWNIGLLHFMEADRLEKDDSRSGSSGAGGRLLIENWRQLSDTLHRDVLFGYDIQKNPQYRARTIDINDDGGLLLEKQDGERVVERSGEIRYLA